MYFKKIGKIYLKNKIEDYKEANLNDFKEAPLWLKNLS